MSRRAAAVLGVALALRLLAVAVSNRTVVDVLRYQKVGEHVLDVSWDPYQAKHLFPYPPVWVWVEAGSLWLSRHAGLDFPIVVKLPVVAAELGIVAWLLRRGAKGDGRAAWAYALHPVSLLVSAFHGQFDAVALAFALPALSSFEAGRRDRSALLLSAAIAVKGFPVLLLPLFLVEGPWPRRLRFAALALVPVLALLLPFVLHDASALSRELFGYGGVGDFGWIGLWRGLAWMASGVLWRSEAAHWPVAVTASKFLFLAVYGLLIAAWAKGRLRWTRTEAALGVWLAFLGLYGAISAQYLLWVVPLGLLVSQRLSLVYAVAATVALAGFYPFLAKGVLWPADRLTAWSGTVAGTLWVLGVAGTLVVSLLWLAVPVLRGRRQIRTSLP